jgi:hypothetical protein
MAQATRVRDRKTVVVMAPGRDADQATAMGPGLTAIEVDGGTAAVVEVAGRRITLRKTSPGPVKTGTRTSGGIMKSYAIIVFALLFLIEPLSAQRGGRGRFCMEPLAGEDLRVIEGTVEDFRGRSGRGMPTLVVKQGDGSLVAVTVGPYSAWMDSEFTVEKGHQVVVNAFTCPGNPEAATALEILNRTNGTDLRLRDENGMPLTRGRGRGGAGWRGGWGRGQ